MEPSNHKRKARRKHRIERLQKEAKSDKADVTGVSRKIARLQRQNNHVAVIYSNLFTDYREYIRVFTAL
jgi:isopentenyl phosphate kinase